jgi:DegV family protein with EDD domain
VAKKDFMIVTDGGSDITSEVAEELDIIVTPLHVVFGGTEDLLDKIDITAEEFVRRLESEPELPTTSGSNLADMLKGYEKALERADSVLGIHIADEISVTLDSAHRAKKQLKDADITIIDSRSVVAGQALPVIAAAKAAQAGASRQEVIELVNSLIPKTNALLTVETLKYFLAGGRITVTQAFVANLLGLHPIIRIYDGKLIPVGRERGRKRTVPKMLKTMEEEVGGRGAKVNASVMHLQALDQAQELKAMLEDRFDCQDEVYIFETGSATGTHAGPGVVGFGYYPVEG